MFTIVKVTRVDFSGYRIGIKNSRTLGGVTLASLASSLVLTKSSPAVAYMATYTRGWQFGVGALVASAGPAMRTVGVGNERIRWSGLVTGWIGLGAVIASLTVFDGHTPYPGVAALVPTTGAAAVIAGGLLSGASRISVGRALSWGPMRTVGRLSFAWYLWHWPLLVLVEQKTGTLTWPIRCLLMLVALGLAGVTLVVLEQPIMRSPVVRRRVAAGVAYGLIGTLLATGTALQVGTVALNRLTVGEKTTPTSTFASVFGQDDGRRSGPVTPSALSAKTDRPHGECIIDSGVETPADCTFGVPDGLKVVLFGDSHAHQWQPALEQLAIDHKWSLMVRAKAGCPVPALDPRPDQSIRFSRPECPQWRQQEISEIVSDIRPALIIVSSFSFYVPDRGEILTAWNKSLDQMRSLGVPIAYIRDTPFPDKEIPDCISSALDDWSKCSFARVVDAAHEPVITQTIQGLEDHVSVIDMNPYLCPAEQCPAVRNGTLLYRDNSHITATVAKLLAPAMEQAFVDARLVPKGR